MTEAFAAALARGLARFALYLEFDQVDLALLPLPLRAQVQALFDLAPSPNS